MDSPAASTGCGSTSVVAAGGLPVRSSDWRSETPEKAESETQTLLSLCPVWTHFRQKLPQTSSFWNCWFGSTERRLNQVKAGHFSAFWTRRRAKPDWPASWLTLELVRYCPDWAAGKHKAEKHVSVSFSATGKKLKIFLLFTWAVCTFYFH